jgi:6-phospho-3-hexuloisomerase
MKETDNDLDTACYSLSELMQLMATRIKEIAVDLEQQETSCFLDEMLSAKRIYVTGAGRSGLVSRAFAMRLMHIGFESYVVGETITPALSREDTLVAFSGSGETNSIVDICETAKEVGARICLITGAADSRIRRIADCTVLLSGTLAYTAETPAGYEVRQITGQYRSTSASFAPLGTLYEASALIFSDAVITAMMEARHCSIDEVKGRLSNVQ